MYDLFPFFFFTLLVLFVAGFSLQRAFLARLRTQHPQTWEALGCPTLFLNNSIKNSLAVQRFIWRREYRKLGDPQTTRLANLLRICLAVYTLIFITFVILFLATTQNHVDHTRASEPEIKGSAQFRNQVHEAVALLKARDPDAYVILTNFVGRIQEAKRSGMLAYNTPPTNEMSDATAFYSLTWCAATIAHDSFHSKLYHEYQKAHDSLVPDAAWTGRAAEQQCMKHQLAVMERIGATTWEIDYAKRQANGDYAKDSETWEDYKKRTW